VGNNATEQYRYYLPKMNINWASTTFGVASWIIKYVCISVNAYLNYWPPLWAKILWTILQPPSKNESQLRVNSFCGCTVSCTATCCNALFLNRVISCQLSMYVPIFIFTNMNPMSHRSAFFLACASQGNIKESAFYFTVTLSLTAT
jgi:hypothetical protein